MTSKNSMIKIIQQTKMGHRNIITSVAINKNQLTTGGGDGLINIANIENKAIEITFDYGYPILQTMYYGDKLFVCGVNQIGLHLIDIPTKTQEFITNRDIAIYHFISDHKNNFALIGYKDGIIEYWNLKTKRVQYQCQIENSVNFIEINPDYKTFIAGSKTELILYDLSTGEKIHRYESIKMHQNDHTIHISPNGRTFFIGQQNIITMIDYWTDTVIKQFIGHKDKIISIYSIFSNILFSTSKDKKIKIWDIKTGNELSNTKIKDEIYSSIIWKETYFILSGNNKIITGLILT